MAGGKTDVGGFLAEEEQHDVGISKAQCDLKWVITGRVLAAKFIIYNLLCLLRSPKATSLCSVVQSPR